VEPLACLPACFITSFCVFCALCFNPRMHLSRYNTRSALYAGMNAGMMRLSFLSGAHFGCILAARVHPLNFVLLRSCLQPSRDSSRSDFMAGMIGLDFLGGWEPAGGMMPGLEEEQVNNVNIC
jgi:hypothetical protein